MEDKRLLVTRKIFRFQGPLVILLPSQTARERAKKFLAPLSYEEWLQETAVERLANTITAAEQAAREAEKAKWVKACKVETDNRENNPIRVATALGIRMRAEGHAADQPAQPEKWEPDADTPLAQPAAAVKPKFGDLSTCRNCGREIRLLGKYWEHTEGRFRHPALPETAGYESAKYKPPQGGSSTAQPAEPKTYVEAYLQDPDHRRQFDGEKERYFHDWLTDLEQRVLRLEEKT